MPPPPPGAAPPTLWEIPMSSGSGWARRFANIVFDRATILVPALSVAHHRDVTERTAGPALKLVESLRAADGRIFDPSSGEGLVPDVLQRGCRACCRQIISAPAMTAKTMNVPCLVGTWPFQSTETISARANTTQMTRHSERSGCSGNSIGRSIESKTPAIADGWENARRAAGSLRRHVLLFAPQGTTGLLGVVSRQPDSRPSSQRDG